MKRHQELNDEQVRALIEAGEIGVAGHWRHRIYGRLDCRSGRRYMARINRVFFRDEHDAVRQGFRPCSACMREEYAAWRDAQRPAPALRLAA